MIKTLYQDHFDIQENPFSIIPDPSYLYMSPRHQEALAHLAYGISSHGGFVLLTGEIGTGKTTICRALLERLPEGSDLALILNPTLSEPELLAAICDEMHISYPPDSTSPKLFFDLINAHLLDSHAQGRNPILMIDEAQNLTNQVLEMIRLLTNLETSEKKLLQIILVGQPELNEILAQPAQRQTAQRITARYHLMPLTLQECGHYIKHRLSVAGLDSDVFSSSARKSIFISAQGIPRLINSICDRALLGAYVEGRKHVNKKLARAAADEVFGTQGVPSKASVWGSLLLVLCVAGLMFWVGLDPYKTGIKDTLGQAIKSFLPLSQLLENKAILHVYRDTPDTTNARSQSTDVSKTAGSVLDELIQANTPDMAFQSLFSLWGVNYIKVIGESPCDKAKTIGLSCVQGETDIAGLKAINRPVVISFVMPDGEHIYGIVNAIADDANGEMVTIQFSKRSLSMNAKAFSLRWPGDYLVVWRKSPLFFRTIAFGQQGRDVQELRRLLALVGYGDGPDDRRGKGSLFFGPSLRDKLRAFQNEYGLNPDGIASPKTLLRITGVAKTTSIPFIHRTIGAPDVVHP